MGRPRPAVRGLHWHRLDSVPSPGPVQRKYLCAGVPKGGYSVRLLGAKTEIPANSSLRLSRRNIMTSSRRHQNWIFEISLRAATAALAIAFVLTAVATRSAQAQTFTVIHTFTQGADGGNPGDGFTIDRGGTL